MKNDISKALPKVFDKERIEVFKKLRAITSGILGGGTAIALQLIHRKSFDFDIFFPNLSRKILYSLPNALHGLCWR